MKSFIFTLLILTTIIVVNAQTTREKHEVSVVFGLNQPIVTQGFNFEIDYWSKKFVYEYSHGFGLKFRDDLVTSEARNQHVAFKITNSLGFGFGYRFTDKFNVRIEPKWHQWEMYYDDAFNTPTGKITTYNTYTLGLGAYYRWTPFEKENNALKRITIAPSVRWWPNIATSLKDDKFEYQNSRTEQTEVHKANNIGLSNSPFFVNVSIGYMFNKRG